MLGLATAITTMGTIAAILFLFKGNDEFMGKTRPTKPLLSICDIVCPMGKDLKQNNSHVSIPNGCGSSGFNFDFLVTSGHIKCCYHHDYCYGTCNNKKERCDEQFKECLKSACSRKTFNSNKCIMEGEILYKSVQEGGCVFYQKAQHDACVCV